jgi:signal transduction histidine kinase/ActR/RegA family two-component response regulator
MLSAVRRSLRAKIVSVVLLTTFAALGVAAAALIVYEARTYSAFLVADADTQAQILADITAPALAFDDPAGAQMNLELLSTRQEVQAAAIYTADGGIFAQYARASDTTIPAIGATGSTISGTTLTVFRPIVQNDTLLGTVYVQSSYELANRIWDYVFILLGVMVPSFGVAGLISLWLTGTVTNPLHAATDVARHVIEHRDFTRRAPRQSDDEVGLFVDAFNTMVAEVGQHAAELEASNRALQQETEERRLAVVALFRSDQRKDEFLATLAHELRNPLAPMVNALDLLGSRALNPEMAAKAQSIMRRQLAHMVRLIDDLLDVSRITSGKLVMRKQTVELAQVIQNAVDTAQPSLDERQHTLTVELPAQPASLEGDPVRLSQVFANLLNNAAKFSDTGKHIALQATVAASEVRVRVADHGIGIEPELAPHIFEMFMQGETAQGTASGLGVGLALARHLVELHGGTITAESEGPGRGSVFTVTLPLATRAPSPVESLPEKRASGRARRIVLVDDNVDFATTLAFLLQGLGHEVRVAHNGTDALAIAREFRPELAFLDLGLPDISGYQLAGSLRDFAETADTVLVAVSGWGQQRDRERSKEAGFAMHLVKPVEFNSIRAAMAALLPGT